MSFTLKKEQHIPEVNASVKLFSHDKSGAQLMSVTNSDENKVFGITFRTPPKTSNGIAHIMEHSVLCGSRKYPVKEPFIELAKGSLNTFLNAFTYPDKTCYPVASQNLQDFYNLIDVYLDAVFYPLIPEHTLQQEGWHFELETTDSPLTFKGVVLNEMKGAYSSPDDLLEDKSRNSIFPDHTYGLDSGGDPAVIPDLTYEEFKSFHEDYYHPSNSYIWFYGDDPEDKRLEYLDGWLNGFEKKEVPSQIPLQRKFEKPIQKTVIYDSGNTEDAKAYLTVNWMLGEHDVKTGLSLDILAHILLATPASPLKKALLDSSLGEDVVGGHEDQLRQTTFQVGMKGINQENLKRVEKLILDTLADLVRNGIDPDTIGASLNTIEFRMREQNTGRFPRGLFMMLNALTSWLYEADPIDVLAFEAPLNAIKEEAAKEGYFEKLIQNFLLDNPHRSTVHLIPDPEEGARINAAEAERLSAAKAGMSPQEIEQTIDNARQLRALQDAPDSPEALAKLPSLSLNDIDSKNKSIPIDIQTIGSSPVLFHNLPTNGIIYLDIGFDLHGLPADLLPFVGIFGRLLLHMGTETQNYVQLTQRIGRETGGIHSATITSTIRESNDSALWFFLRGKAVISQADDLLEILKDILLSARFDNRERFKQIVIEDKARAESGLIPGGHLVINNRLRAHFGEADWISEKISGVEQLFFLRALIDEIEKDWDSILVKLETVRRLLINRNAMIANVTLEADSFASFSPRLASFIDALPGFKFDPVKLERGGSAKFEGLTIPAQVNYVGKGANLYRLGYEPHGSINVINNYLGTTWLWEKVRVQGGAYGGFSLFDMNSGTFTFLSYRDPNLLKTIENYDKTVDFLAGLDLSTDELKKSIIGTIGTMDTYQLPDAKGWTSMTRYLINYTDDERQRIRDEVLSTTERDFKKFSHVLSKLNEVGEVVVLGSLDAIEKANQDKADFLEIKKVM